MLPHTDAHQAPADITNPYGAGMHHSEMMKRLKVINPALQAPLPEHYPGWFPGKESGVTCLWLGTPSAPTSKKICAFTLGVIPEFTIKEKNGMLKQKGWRAIFAKLIKAKVATRHQIEAAFLVNLDRDERRGDGLCLHCARAGKRVKAIGADRLCQLHHMVNQFSLKASEDKKERKWLASLSPEKRAAQSTSSRVVVDLRCSPSPTNSR